MSDKWLLAALLLHIGLLLPYACQVIYRCRQHRNRARAPRCGMKWEDELIGEPNPAKQRRAGSRSLF